MAASNRSGESFPDSHPDCMLARKQVRPILAEGLFDKLGQRVIAILQDFLSNIVEAARAHMARQEGCADEPAAATEPCVQAPAATTSKPRETSKTEELESGRQSGTSILANSAEST